MDVTETVRPPAVAGRFYTQDGEALRAQIDDDLAHAPAPSKAAPKAVIGPHAGLRFSGPVAATAFRQLAPAQQTIERVVVIGPSHFVAFRGIAAPSVDWFQTPLGHVPVDRDGVATALEQSGVVVDDAPHQREHSVEIHLLFIQRVLGDVPVIPLVVGNAQPAQVGRVLAALWGGDETAIAVSSDLSHFQDDATARALDRATADAIEAKRVDALSPADACGYLPVGGLLWNVADTDARVQTLDLRNSSDAGAPRASVVGYGAFTLQQGPS